MTEPTRSHRADDGMSMLAHIGEIAPYEFDALDPASGAVACYGRLKQREADQRWRASYLRAIGDGFLQAVIPVYTCRSMRWPDPAYDFTAWPLYGEMPDLGGVESALLVGGCLDRRSNLHIRRDRVTASTLHRLTVQLARLAAADDRFLIFPYVYGDTKDDLSEATGNSIVWAALSREARLYGVSDPDWERAQGSRISGVLRHDRRLIASARVQGSVRSWPEAGERASRLVAEHNSRKGGPDHPEFVWFRYSEWQQCEGVELVVFESSASGVSGALIALIWNDELELCEIGLTGADSQFRLAVYLDLLFHRPLTFARSRNLRNIRLGYAAELPKKSRGAVFEVLYGGVLHRTCTRRIADENP